jgi:hypothetical protein
VSSLWFGLCAVPLLPKEGDSFVVTFINLVLPMIINYILICSSLVYVPFTPFLPLFFSISRASCETLSSRIHRLTFLVLPLPVFTHRPHGLVVFPVYIIFVRPAHLSIPSTL